MFHMMPGSLATLGWASTLWRRHGWLGFLKLLGKLATPSRQYYAITRDGAVVADGWILVGRCASYEIGPHESVIGPIWTDPAARGQGLARAGLAHAACWSLTQGVGRVHIDTSTENVASQRAIIAAGFHLEDR